MGLPYGDSFIIPIPPLLQPFLADRLNGRAYTTVLIASVVVVVCRRL